MKFAWIQPQREPLMKPGLRCISEHALQALASTCKMSRQFLLYELMVGLTERLVIERNSQLHTLNICKVCD